MPFLRRHVARFGWFGLRRNANVILQIQDERNGKWRDANARDLLIWEEEQKHEAKRAHTNGFFPIGTRVVINQQSGFSKGSTGVVQFQEPNEGRVWVLRDGADGPCYFYGRELTYARDTFSKPKQDALRWNNESVRCWWIAIGDGRIDSDIALKWCEENGVEGSILLCHDYDHPEASLYLAGFAEEGDAMLFYLRFK